MLKEPFKPPNRPTGARDESVDSFLSRRFGETFARIFGSSLVHGIYAADSRNLSVRAAFPVLWEAEERGWGSVVAGLLIPAKRKEKSDQDNTYDLGGTMELMRQVSVFSFKDGIQYLTKALESRLRATKNVEIIRNTNISNLEMLKDGSLKVGFFVFLLAFKISFTSSDRIVLIHLRFLIHQETSRHRTSFLHFLFPSCIKSYHNQSLQNQQS
jgi:oxygen-dependent protoporphyrinogen oxidase